MSDRDKGLVKADSAFPNAVRAYCCLHIAENIQAKFGLHAHQLFWKIARTHSIAGYQHNLADLQALSSAAASYVTAIPPELFATSHFPGHRYWHDTSNIVESVNSSYWRIVISPFSSYWILYGTRKWESAFHVCRKHRHSPPLIDLLHMVSFS